MPSTPAAWRVEARAREGIEDRLSRQAEFIEGIVGENTRAVHWNARLRVLFEDRDIEAGAGESGRRE